MERQRFCHQCGKPLEPVALMGAPMPATAVLVGPMQHVVIVKPAKSPGLAVVLSFFIIGLGHIYAGDAGKGIGLFLVAVFSLPLTMMLGIGWLLLPILWIYGMIDAYKTAERMNAAARMY